MGIINQIVEDNYALYNGDCIQVMPDFKSDSVGLIIYSPPFRGLYNYSSADEDLSNCKSPEEFMEHYRFVVKETYRLLQPGRIAVVHVMDVPTKNGLHDFTGDIIKLHEEEGFYYHDRKVIWKEPLRVAIRTRSLGLRHGQIVKDATICRSAQADFMLAFRKKGENQNPVEHPIGFQEYYGERPIPAELDEKYKNWKDHKTNKRSHWIWQQYASSVWIDIRVNRVLEYKPARDKEDEKHCHPLQLDAIDRCIDMWSNKGDIVFTPFMGVGSEVYSAIRLERKGIGIELKPTYFNQAKKNIVRGIKEMKDGIKQSELEFSGYAEESLEDEPE